MKKHVTIISSPITARYVKPGDEGEIDGNQIRVNGVWFDYSEDKWKVKPKEMSNEEYIERESTKETLIDAIYSSCESVCKTITIEEIMETIEASKKTIKDHLSKLPYSKK